MAEPKSPLDWDHDGRDWPDRDASHFVTAAGIRWRVQQFGKGPAALLIHGTGSSAHSWSWLVPYLSRDFSLLALDLPGHAFTSSLASSRMTLPGLSSMLSALLATMRVAPELVVGHSAGAAILVRMSLEGLIAPRVVVSINGALTPFPGPAALLFPAMARMLFLNPLSPRFFAWRAKQPGAVERLIEGTGSHIPPESMTLYRRMFRTPAHVAGALAMMSNWDLAGLNRNLPGLKQPLLQLVGSNDRAVPCDQAFQIARRLPGSRTHLLRGLGHLAHEEDPATVAHAILQEMDHTVKPTRPAQA